MIRRERKKNKKKKGGGKADKKPYKNKCNHIYIVQYSFNVH